MRLLHTSDWHLGHTLHDFGRELEHSRFLDWLADTLERESIDALLVAGDVFDSANPPASAEKAWYDFLARVARRLPLLDVVVVGGNHDSAARLDVAAGILSAFGVHVVGGWPIGPGEAPDLDRLLVPLGARRSPGEPWAWVAAVPYLRMADLPSSSGDPVDEVVEGVRARYEEILAQARSRRRPGQALVATGHCYMAGGELSELSERKILGGNLHALPVDIFGPDVSYVALGHLHRAQAVKGREEVRYSGSPLPLSVDEAAYPHQVLVCEFEGGELSGVRPVRVPRTVDILRLPNGGPAGVETLMQELRELDVAGARPAAEWPYLDVHVVLQEPQPDLKRQVEEAIAGRAVRLVRIGWESPGDGATLAEQQPGRGLAEIDEETVFVARYRQTYDGDVPPDLLAAFHEVREAAARGELG